MVDAFRKQLDALMGANRNGDVTEVKRSYRDRDVCRLFLCGLCPHDLFQLTKMDLGQCQKIHSLELRKEYEEARTKGKDNFEREMEENLEKHVIECDRKIQRALKRLEDDNQEGATAIAVSEVTKSSEADELSKQINEKLKESEDLELAGNSDDKIRLMDVVEELRQKRADRQAQSLLEAFNKDRLNAPPMGGPPQLAPLPMAFPGTQLVLGPPDARTQEMIKEKLKEAEELGELGKVDEAQKAMEEAEALKRLGSRPDPGQLLPMAGGNIQIADQKLRVCDICGAFLSIYDSDRRLADHFGGKLHLGYMQIREKLKNIKEARKVPHRKTPADDDKADVTKEKGEPDKDRDRARSKDRDRSRDRDRERDRDRDRERDRDRDRERHRDRDRDNKDRERERDRRRSRSRSRERDDRPRDRHRDRDDRRRYGRNDRDRH